MQASAVLKDKGVTFPIFLFRFSRLFLIELVEMNIVHTKLLFAAIPLLAAGCSHSSHVVFSEPDSRLICRLDDHENPVGSIKSLCFLSDTSFVVSARNSEAISVFDLSGELLNIINRSGRGQLEYYSPGRVRTWNGRIVVWSTSLLKFIEYEPDGTPIREWQYPSACSDFLVSEKYIVIYTNGVRDSHIIDLLNKETGEVSSVGKETVWSHKVLNVNDAVSPFCMDGDILYYMPRNELSVWACNLKTGDISRAAAWTSPSFVVDDLQDDIIPDRNRLIPFLQKNSLVVGLCKTDGAFMVLTLEGENRPYAGFGERYYSLYTVSGQDVAVSHFLMSDIAEYDRITEWRGHLYYLHHIVENSEDIYELQILTH